jgi:hypothetical protein
MIRKLARPTHLGGSIMFHSTKLMAMRNAMGTKVMMQK